MDKIEEQKLNIVELATETQEIYAESKILRDELEPMFKELYINISPRDKELEEMGEYDLSNKYYYTIGTTFKDFKRSIHRDHFGHSINKEISKKQQGMYDMAILRAKDLYNMERTKYLYRAYKQVLGDKLTMLDYNYNKPLNQQL